MASPDRPRTGGHRIADVALRHLAPGRRARVHWPAPCADPTVAALVVLFAGDDDLVDELMARLRAVVLTVSATHAVEAHAAVRGPPITPPSSERTRAGWPWSATAPARQSPSGSPSLRSTRAGHHYDTWR